MKAKLLKNKAAEMLKIFFGCFLFGAVCLSVTACASSAVKTETIVAEGNVLLVQDAPTDEIMPKSFRTSEDIRTSLKKGAGAINAAGLEGLPASGSAEFSGSGLIWLKQNLGENLIIVDLRQESHGFLNGAPVTWYVQNNWINLGKTREQALQDESSRLDALAQKKSVRIYDAKAVKYGISSPGRDMEAKQVCSEEQLVQRHKIGYFRLTVPDHMRPSDEDVDRFVAFVRTLSDKDWLHVHCRAGMGRTTTFLAMYDMLRNADKVSLEDIVARQAAVRPYYNLFDIRSKKPEGDIYRDRANFLRHFYEYAKAFCAGEKSSWSKWSKERLINKNSNQTETK